MYGQIHMNKTEKLIQQTNEAFKHVIDKATELLPTGSPYTFEGIVWAYEDFRRAAKQEDRYIARTGGKYCNLMNAMVTRNLRDVYWKLPTPVKELWDANWELAAYLKKFR